jgi:nitrogen fixation/metabolism regulation signal transduction histidine kinase
MSIRAKLFISFMTISVLILTLFVVRQYFSVKEAELVRELVVDHEISVQLSGLSAAAQKIRRYEKEFFIYVQNPKKRAKYAGEFADANAEIESYIKRLQGIYSANRRDGELAKLQTWQKATRFYAGGFGQITDAVENGTITGVLEANAAIQKYKNDFRVVLSGTEQSIRNQYQLATAKSDRIGDYQYTAALVFMVIAVLSLSLSVFMSIQVPASVIKPLKKMTMVANAISKGQLNDSVDIKGSAEIEDLASSIKRLQTATLGLLKRLQHARKQSQMAAQQIEQRQGAAT